MRICPSRAHWAGFCLSSLACAASFSSRPLENGCSTTEETNAYGGYGSGAIYTNARMDMPAAEASTMVQASSLEVVATVTMEFALAEGE